MKLSRLNRLVHRWASFVFAIPLIVIIVSGVILQLKKDVDWVQPPTRKGSNPQPEISFDRILKVAKTVPQAKVGAWDDIDRLDVRPGKGIVKVRAKSRWEIQIDTHTTEIVQVAYRRSDLIEEIHDGSFFSSDVKLWVFLPTPLILLLLWCTGLYLFILPYTVKWRRKKRPEKKPAPPV